MALDLGSITAFLELDISLFQQNYRRAEREAAAGANNIDKSNSTIEKGMKKLAGFFAGLSIVSFFKDSIDAASDLSETINKSNTIFGANAREIDKWGNNSAKALGLSKAAALESAATFGDMFSQIGFTGDEAAKLSTKVIELSADLGSFNNLPTADVADKISAAFRGEYDSLQALIPNINGARVETEALAATGKDSAAALTAQEKATAVLAIITKDGARAIGDFAKTSDGFANSQKIVAAEFENTKAAIGEGLLPAAQALLGLFQEVGIPVISAIGAAVGFLAELLMDVPGPVWAAVAAFAGLVVVGKIGGFLTGLAYILPIIINGMGGLAASATLAGRALGILGGPIVVGLGLVAAAITFLVANSEDATIAIGDLSDAVDSNTGRLKENAAELIAAQVTDAASKYVELGGAVGDFTLALSGNEAAQARVNAVLREAGIAALEASGKYQGVVTSTNTAGLTAEQAYDSFLKFGGSLTNFGDELNTVGGVQDAYNNGLGQLEEAQAAANTAITETTAAVEAQGGAAAATAPTIKSLQEATKELSKAADFANAAVQFLTLSLDQASGRAISTEAATRAYDAALRGIGAAARDTADAMAEQDAKAQAVHAAVAEFGAGSLEAANAQREFEDSVDAVASAQDGQFKANQQVQQSALAVATAAYQTAAANGDLAGASAAATASIEGARAAFIRAQPEADRLSGKADATATALFGIPGQVATTLTENGAANVQSQARGTRDAVNQVPTSRNTEFTVSTPPRNTMDDYINQIGRVPTRKTTVFEQIIQNMTPGGATGGKAADLFPGYAAGGKLRGKAPANPWIDNLWAYGPGGGLIRLRSEEWVVNQPAAMYYGDKMMADINARRFPKIPGYAAGGKAGVVNLPSTPPAFSGQSIVTVEQRIILEVQGDGVLAQLIRDNAMAIYEDSQTAQGRSLQFRR